MRVANLKPEIYKAGGEGPAGQHNLMKGTNFKWYQPS